MDPQPAGRLGCTQVARWRGAPSLPRKHAMPMWAGAPARSLWSRAAVCASLLPLQTRRFGCRTALGASVHGLAAATVTSGVRAGTAFAAALAGAVRRITRAIASARGGWCASRVWPLRPPQLRPCPGVRDSWTSDTGQSSARWYACQWSGSETPRRSHWPTSCGSCTATACSSSWVPWRAGNVCLANCRRAGCPGVLGTFVLQTVDGLQTSAVAAIRL